ncbi:hypothetical protein K470DRAFT_276455 [Piedraia hortae CBS 480.64]|uniref:Uncharacterized protein n=1 Tax=Piedraia hortae CBS 480.64 TaxID=1314780 RepID=A0A6A7C0Z3_9PEZI|nr:hypothetical protein K470DRAFT_276455 [Piedraia hortae CBS 480.64]
MTSSAATTAISQSEVSAVCSAGVDSDIPRPLLCGICPRKKEFSDISHLLTHVASKAHLSASYKLQVRSQTDPQAKRLLDSYDNWYRKHRIDQRMSQRLINKDEKAAARGLGKTPTHRPSVGSTPLGDQSGDTALFSGLEPLHISGNHTESMDMMDFPTNAYFPDGGEESASSFMPLLAVPFDPYSNLTMETGVLDNLTPDSGHSPTAESFLHHQLMTPDNSFFQDFDPTANFDVLPSIEDPTSTKTDENIPLADETSAMDYVSEAYKLKGNIWPGMNVFDSATLEQKRNRNQAKHESVMMDMERAVQNVQPTEMVFDSHSGLDLQVQRVITGNAEIDYEFLLPGEIFSGDEAKKTIRGKKRGRPSRAALQERNVNTGRLLDMALSHMPAFGNYLPTEDNLSLVEDGLGHRKKTKRVEVFRDNSGENISLVNEHLPLGPFENPACHAHEGLGSSRRWNTTSVNSFYLPDVYQEWRPSGDVQKYDSFPEPIFGVPDVGTPGKSIYAERAAFGQCEEETSAADLAQKNDESGPVIPNPLLSGLNGQQENEVITISDNEQ